MTVLLNNLALHCAMPLHAGPEPSQVQKNTENKACDRLHPSGVTEFLKCGLRDRAPTGWQLLLACQLTPLFPHQCYAGLKIDDIKSQYLFRLRVLLCCIDRLNALINCLLILR